MNVNDESNLSISDILPPEIEEHVVKYVQLPTCIAVCQRWKCFVENRPWKHMPIRVHKLRVARYKWESGRNGMDYKVTSYVIDEAASDEHNKRFIKKYRRYTLNDIFPLCLWMFLPEEFEINNLNYDEQQALLDNIPHWWRYDIKKFSSNSLMMDPMLHSLVVFPNLHSIGNNEPILSNESKVRELISNMKFISNYILFVKQPLYHHIADYLLPLISAKSKKLEKFYTSYVFSLPAFITFLKETDFAKKVTIRVRYFEGSGLELESFLQNEATNCKPNSLKFEYKGSLISIFATH